MTARVFIVDEKTLPLHLRYQFAGTGAKKNSCIHFNGAAQANLHHSTEKALVGMIADISRVRTGGWRWRSFRGILSHPLRLGMRPAKLRFAFPPPQPPPTTNP